MTVYISVLGEGWNTAVLDNDEEKNFIHQNQRNFSDIGDYWIGGGTSVRPVNSFEYSDYIPEQSASVTRYYYIVDGKFGNIMYKPNDHYNNFYFQQKKIQYHPWVFPLLDLHS